MQNKLVREKVPHAQILMINECGHNAWLEQPEIFYGEIIEFLLITNH
jgi:pimeloyl-ACP methyl ester carboxylesterase